MPHSQQNVYPDFVGQELGNNIQAIPSVAYAILPAYNIPQLVHELDHDISMMA